MTLAASAYGVRMDIERASPDLNEWAARHGVPTSGRYAELEDHALVLWHGTGRERADKIQEHGLFHRRGLWTAQHPAIAHGFCRGRSERFGTEGAVVCIVLNRTQIEEGRDFEFENGQNVLRFYHALPPDVVEYVLVHDEIRFTGDRRAHGPAPWHRARLKKWSGEWIPIQNTPVRYSTSAHYSTLAEFTQLTLERLLETLGPITGLEMFSCLYATVTPWDALEHRRVLDLLEETCVPYRHRGGWQTFRSPARSEASAQVPGER